MMTIIKVIMMTMMLVAIWFWGCVQVNGEYKLVLFCISAGGFSPTGRGGLPAYNTLGTDPPHQVETILPPGRGHAGVEEGSAGEIKEKRRPLSHFVGGGGQV